MGKNKKIVYKNSATPLRDCEIEKAIMENDYLETSNELVLLYARTLMFQKKIDTLTVYKDGKFSRVNEFGRYVDEDFWDGSIADNCYDIILGL